MIPVEIIQRGVLESFSWGTQKVPDISRFYCASASITRSLAVTFIWAIPSSVKNSPMPCRTPCYITSDKS